MISPVTVQTSLIALLKANVALVAALDSAAEIKEEEWRGTGFKYPAVRVAISDMSPRGNGACAEGWLDVYGAIMVFSKESSSSEALTILGLIENTLQRQRLSAAGITSLDLKIERVVYPDRDENVWRGEVDFTTTVIET